jgi:hypothetical protein
MASKDSCQRRQSSVLAANDEVYGDKCISEVPHWEADDPPERGLGSRRRELTGNVADRDHECPSMDKGPERYVEDLGARQSIRKTWMFGHVWCVQ